MDVYLDRIREYNNRLGAAGQAVTDEDLVLYTVNGLGHEFAALKTALRAGLQTITFNYLCSLLRSEEIHMLRELKLTPVAETHSAFAAQVVQQQGMNKGTEAVQQLNTSMGLYTAVGNTKQEGGVMYENFGGPGRGFDRGSRGGRSGGRYVTSGPRVFCQICGRGNHIALECWNRYNPSFVPQQSHHPTFQSPTQYNYPPQTYQTSAPLQPNSQPYSPNYNRPPLLPTPRSPAPQLQNAYSTSNSSNTPQLSSSQTSAQSHPQAHFVTQDSAVQNMTVTDQMHSLSLNPTSDSQPTHTVSFESLLFPQDTPKALTASLSAHEKDLWFLDTGASNHLTHDPDRLIEAQAYRGNKAVTVGNGTKIPIAHVGKGALSTAEGLLHLEEVLHAPLVSHNLLSVSQLTKDNNCRVIFDSLGFVVQDKLSGKTVLQGKCEQGLYNVCSNQPEAGTALLSCTTQSPHLWHCKLGHPCSNIMKHVSSTHKLPFLSSTAEECHVCCKTKSHKLPFPISSSITYKPLELVHSDVWGPTQVVSPSGFKYYVLFIDDFSRYTWTYPLKLKSDVLNQFKVFKAAAENQFTTKLKCLRTDNGGEYVSNEFAAFLKENGILHQKTCPHTPQQNGVSERKHRHLVETTLSLLEHSFMPKKLWVEALLTATYLINRMPSSVLNWKSPYEVLFKLSPDYSAMRVFGCCCYPWLQPYRESKLTPKAKCCVFVGYCSQSKGYRCLEIQSGRVYISRHVKFLENQFPFSPTFNPNPLYFIDTSISETASFESSPPIETESTTGIRFVTSSTDTLQVPELIPEQQTSDMSPTNSQLSNTSSLPPVSSPLGTSTNSSEADTTNCTYPVPTEHPMLTRSKAKSLTVQPTFNALTTVMTDLPIEKEPTTFAQAIKNGNWTAAMQEEYNALMTQQTWTLVPAAPHQSIVGCKWVYKIKYNADGSISRYKARLVAKGFHQTEGLDFFETFSPVVKQPTVRVVLTLALHYDWPIRQLDVSNAFLHGLLEEDVYMEQPKGFVDPIHPNYVCKLHKSLYGLKQAPRAWFSTFSAFLLNQGFTHSLADSSLFVKQHNGETLVLLVYVDDILLTGSKEEGIQELIYAMKKAFTLKDLGFPHLFLGIQVLKCSAGWFLSQSHYAAQLIDKAALRGCNPCSTPIVYQTANTEDDPPFQDVTLYRSLAGSLLYLTLTRPDISYAVNWICQFMHAPLTSHFIALKRILRYLSGCLDNGLLLQPGSLDITGYADSDWAGDREDRKSTTGYCIFMGENLIAWCAKKQPTIARSSTEAEYKALANAAAEVMWLSQLMKDLHSMPDSIPLIWCDNMSALALANNPVFHARTKHVEVDYHFIREKIQHKALSIDYVPSAQQLADIFTKPLNSPQFLNLKAQFPLFMSEARCFPEGNHLEGGCKGKDQLAKDQLAEDVKDLADSDIAAMTLGPQSAENLNHGQSTILIELPTATASDTADEGLKLLNHQHIHQGGVQVDSQASLHSQPPSQPAPGQLAYKAQVVSKLSTFKAHAVQGEDVNYSRHSSKSLGPQ